MTEGDLKETIHSEVDSSVAIGTIFICVGSIIYNRTISPLLLHMNGTSEHNVNLATERHRAVAT